MYSLDFEEFLWAKGYTSDVVEDMLTGLNSVLETLGLKITFILSRITAHSC